MSSVSQRRAARLLRINRKTVVRKFLLLGAWSEALLYLTNRAQPLATEVQFDDLETFEHSKYKPLSVTAAVEFPSRRILGFRVARIPAKGILAAAARKKYGPRKDETVQSRKSLFQELQSLVSPDAEFASDMHQNYPRILKKYFPRARHAVHRSRKACVVGQGELKGGGYDPLFCLNHTFAMKRANINRLVRKTWCTTKRPERLSLHLAMYALYHNLCLI